MLVHESRLCLTYISLLSLRNLYAFFLTEKTRIDHIRGTLEYYHMIKNLSRTMVTRKGGFL